MKIDGPDKTGKTGQAGKSKKSSDAKTGDSSFSDLLVNKSEGAQANTAASAITATDVLLSVQASDDPAERSKRQYMADRADRILDKLEQIRTAMLTGNLTVGDMVDIADMVARHREKVSDPSLTAILDEIDLRAQIELAKMRVRLDRAEGKSAESTSEN